MNTWIAVARYHLVDRRTYLLLPWAALGLVFLINRLTDLTGPGPNPTKALVVIYLCFFGLGILSIGRSLPFGLALGMSRRSYYAGTMLLVVALAVADGLALALLQVAERATHGWGVGLHFFQVSYILSGPWYLTWLTSTLGLTLLFLYGLWYGIIFRRWNRVGMVAFIIAQVALVSAWILVVGVTNSAPRIAHFFTAAITARFTGALAAVAVALLIGGYVLVRRVTV
ncbi:MAG: ABC transporter permease [Candidatus Dormiibacterota bacterium]